MIILNYKHKPNLTPLNSPSSVAYEVTMIESCIILCTYGYGKIYNDKIIL